jgi:hypothetical protein
MQTAIMLEAEWNKLSTGAKEDQVLGVFELLDFILLQPVLAWRAFLSL